MHSVSKASVKRQVTQSRNALKYTWERVNDPEVLLSQRTTFTKWGFLQCSLFVKLLPLRHDACKCHCTHIARLQAGGRTYCWHGVKPEETCLICPPLSLTLSFSSIALFYCFRPYPICPCQHGCYSVRLRRGS